MFSNKHIILKPTYALLHQYLKHHLLVHYLLYFLNITFSFLLFGAAAVSVFGTGTVPVTCMYALL